MINKLLSKIDSTFYVQIWKNRIKVTNIKTGKVFDEKPLVAVFEDEKKIKKIEAIGNNAALSVGKNITVTNPFNHERSLLSNFVIGEKLLQHIFNELTESRIFGIRPNVVMHPMEKLDGGLTDIEVNALKDMSIGAGARNTVVYQGSELLTVCFDFDSFKTK